MTADNSHGTGFRLEVQDALRETDAEKAAAAAVVLLENPLIDALPPGLQARIRQLLIPVDGAPLRGIIEPICSFRKRAEETHLPPFIEEEPDEPIPPSPYQNPVWDGLHISPINTRARKGVRGK